MGLTLDKNRIIHLISITPIILIGLYTKWYNGPAASWVNDNVGGLFYVVFWCLALSLIIRRVKPGIIAVSVLVATCGLEFLQLWHPAPLVLIRSTFIGRTVLGTSFSWSDFPYYGLGALASWLWLRMLRQKKGRIPAGILP